MSTVVKEAPSRLGALILLWLLAHAGEGTPSNLEDLPKLLGKQRSSEADRKRAVAEDLAALEKAGHVERRRRSARVITESGRRAALAALGVTAPLEKSDWSTLKRAYLARLPELPTKPAAILAEQCKLDFLGPAPTFEQVRDALAWQALGVRSSKPFHVREVRELLFTRMDHAPALPEGKPPADATGTQTVEVGPATLPPPAPRTVGPAAPPPPATRTVEQPPAPPPAPPRPPAPQTELPADNGAFAKRVLAAARATKTGRFGNHKVFISHVLRHLAAEGFAIENEKVKARLVSAHQAGLLSLTRADMVEAMPADDVSASETAYRNATFHFVRI